MRRLVEAEEELAVWMFAPEYLWKVEKIRREEKFVSSFTLDAQAIAAQSVAVRNHFRTTIAAQLERGEACYNTARCETLAHVIILGRRKNNRRSMVHGFPG